MTTVKFDKSVKYEGIRYPAHKTFEVKDSDVRELRKSGATVLSVAPDINDDEIIEETESGTTTNEDTASQLKEAMLKYSVPQLIKYAQEHNIDLQGKTRKADIYNIIVSTL